MNIHPRFNGLPESCSTLFNDFYLFLLMGKLQIGNCKETGLPKYIKVDTTISLFLQSPAYFERFLNSWGINETARNEMNDREWLEFVECFAHLETLERGLQHFGVNLRTLPQAHDLGMKLNAILALFRSKGKSFIPKDVWNDGALTHSPLSCCVNRLIGLYLLKIIVPNYWSESRKEGIRKIELQKLHIQRLKNITSKAKKIKTSIDRLIQGVNSGGIGPLDDDAVRWLSDNRHHFIKYCSRTYTGTAVTNVILAISLLQKKEVVQVPNDLIEELEKLSIYAFTFKGKSYAKNEHLIEVLSFEWSLVEELMKLFGNIGCLPLPSITGSESKISSDHTKHYAFKEPLLTKMLLLLMPETDIPKINGLITRYRYQNDNSKRL